MAYEPGVITKLSNMLSQLDSVMPGHGLWYGEAGKDVTLAKMILDDESTADIKAYIKDNYGEEEEEEDE
jgi:hypothetical protein